MSRRNTFLIFSTHVHLCSKQLLILPTTPCFHHTIWWTRNTNKVAKYPTASLGIKTRCAVPPLVPPTIQPSQVPQPTCFHEQVSQRTRLNPTRLALLSTISSEASSPFSSCQELSQGILITFQQRARLHLRMPFLWILDEAAVVLKMHCTVIPAMVQRLFPRHN